MFVKSVVKNIHNFVSLIIIFPMSICSNNISITVTNNIKILNNELPLIRQINCL